VPQYSGLACPFRHTEPPPPAINVLKPAARGSVDVEPVQVPWVSQPSAGPEQGKQHSPILDLALNAFFPSSIFKL